MQALFSRRLVNSLFVLAAVGLSSHILSDIATTTGNAYTLSAPGISATLIPSSPVSS